MSFEDAMKRGKLKIQKPKSGLFGRLRQWLNPKKNESTPSKSNIKPSKYVTFAEAAKKDNSVNKTTKGPLPLPPRNAIHVPSTDTRQNIIPLVPMSPMAYGDISPKASTLKFVTTRYEDTYLSVDVDTDHITPSETFYTTHFVFTRL